MFKINFFLNDHILTPIPYCSWDIKKFLEERKDCQWSKISFSMMRSKIVQKFNKPDRWKESKNGSIIFKFIYLINGIWSGVVADHLIFLNKICLSTKYFCHKQNLVENNSRNLRQKSVGPYVKILFIWWPKSELDSFKKYNIIL